MQNRNIPIIELPPLTEPGAWDAPVLFDEFDTPEIPAHLLPSVLADFAAALSLTSETSTALRVMTILGVLFCALSKRFLISPRAGWLEPINIYSLIALPPANHKSLVLSSCTKPLIFWEQAQTTQKDAEVKKQISALKTQERIIDGLRNKAAKTHDKLARMQLIDEIAALEATLPQLPVLPVLFTNDATPESLASLIYSQGVVGYLFR